MDILLFSLSLYSTPIAIFSYLLSLDTSCQYHHILTINNSDHIGSTHDLNLLTI